MDIRAVAADHLHKEVKIVRFLRSMCFTVMLASLLVTSLPVSADTVAKDALLPPPVLDGGFWQLGPGILEHYSDEDLQAEIEDMHGLGMKVLIIQYAVEPNWKPGQDDYVAYISNTVYPVHPAFKGRNPFGMIFRTADRLGMRVYLGGMLLKQPFEEDYENNVARWSSDEALRYRKELVARFAGYQSFAGYYIPNEPNPYVLVAKRCDPDLLLAATAKVVEAVKSVKPDLEVVMPIGLYLRPTGRGSYLHASRQDLDLFWRPWIERLDQVDTWMVIDGLGTRLSDLDHTAMAQRWARDIAHEFGKAYWTDVENARMYTDAQGRYHSEPFEFGDLVRSMSVASRFADEAITFDYIHFMSQRSSKPEAVRLYEAYQKYVRAFEEDKPQQP
jgi:uncharacterized protein DUF4434